MIKQDCVHIDGRYHDCDYVDGRMKHIPFAESYAYDVAGIPTPALEEGSTEYDVWAERWNVAFHARMAELTKPK